MAMVLSPGTGESLSAGFAVPADKRSSVATALPTGGHVLFGSSSPFFFLEVSEMEFSRTEVSTKVALFCFCEHVKVIMKYHTAFGNYFGNYKKKGHFGGL